MSKNSSGLADLRRRYFEAKPNNKVKKPFCREMWDLWLARFNEQQSNPQVDIYGRRK